MDGKPKTDGKSNESLRKKVVLIVLPADTSGEGPLIFKHEIIVKTSRDDEHPHAGVASEEEDTKVCSI